MSKINLLTSTQQQSSQTPSGQPWRVTAATDLVTHDLGGTMLTPTWRRRTHFESHFEKGVFAGVTFKSHFYSHLKVTFESF